MAQTVVTSEHRRAGRPARRATRHETNTGVSNNKLAIWMFLSSEALFFGAFISTYFLYRGRDAQFLKGPTPDRAAQHPVHVGDVVRAADELAHDGARARRDPARRPPAVPRSGSSPPRCSALTFIGGQVYEFTEFYREGLHLSTNMFGTTFYVLTGLHGAHVTVGIIWLLSLWARSMQGRLRHRASREAVEIAGLYWHFVDIVWIFIFTADLPDSPALRTPDDRQTPKSHEPGTDGRGRRRDAARSRAVAEQRGRGRRGARGHPDAAAVRADRGVLVIVTARRDRDCRTSTPRHTNCIIVALVRDGRGQVLPRRRAGTCT